MAATLTAAQRLMGSDTPPGLKLTFVPNDPAISPHLFFYGLTPATIAANVAITLRRAVDHAARCRLALSVLESNPALDNLAPLVGREFVVDRYSLKMEHTGP